MTCNEAAKIVNASSPGSDGHLQHGAARMFAQFGIGGLLDQRRVLAARARWRPLVVGAVVRLKPGRELLEVRGEHVGHVPQHAIDLRAQLRVDDLEATHLVAHLLVDHLLVRLVRGCGLRQVQFGQLPANVHGRVYAAVAGVEHTLGRQQQQAPEAHPGPSGDRPRDGGGAVLQEEGLQELEEAPGAPEGRDVRVQHHARAPAAPGRERLVEGRLPGRCPRGDLLRQPPLVVAEGADPVAHLVPLPDIAGIEPGVVAQALDEVREGHAPVVRDEPVHLPWAGKLGVGQLGPLC
mmetsp:Transcript_110744/g.357468  ORF Transcript_110744/g.357468 Transcript_110744/m.357468 type:complete len:293 (-) Transcript_110744:551-1429(-)